ncbi:eukaryotic translation initiation factor 4B3-like [Impatiens glandulifera]|uniref:eukaryotic translation initiation factor 4B3-like n=1 Tax=Impatiens glandulifera TaxID=253017 RepID=UPI001FB0BAA2|nr:eukaryotic translation initiation factor 4B3-like [Impatiens glandulifera]
MAATVSNVWAKPGAWALDSEENEAELEQQHKEEIAKKADIKLNGGGADLSDFPSLSSAAVTKTKKKKPQALSLSEFANFSSAKPVQKGPTFQDLASLPTGPRERTAEELDRSRLGGGFRSYGGYGNRNSEGGDDSSNSRWGSNRVSDDSRRQGGFGRESNRDMAPSRADETDDWGATKRTMPNSGFDRRERGDRGGFFGSESKADESDSWVSNKSFSSSEGRRFEGQRERRGGFESNGGSESDNWMKKKEEEGRRYSGGGSGGGGAFDSIRDRRGGFEPDSETWGRKREEGGSGSGGSVRPKLNLQPRTLPVNDNQHDGPAAAPTKPKGSNPFGEARPREEVLKEKGQDWKEMEEKLDSLKIKETGSGKDFGRRNFGNGNSSEARTEREWRKPGHGDATPPSGEETGNENAEAAGVQDEVAGNAED